MAFNLFMHERNIYKERPDFKKIAVEYPEFRKYAVPDEKGRIHIDFNNQDALRMLTKILLKKDFKLDVVIPNGFLIPTVPQRLNYLLWIEDLLALLPKKSILVSGIDIGTGPCAIFSLLGAKKNGWNFVSTETSDEAIQWAEKNIKTNNLESLIKVIQVSKDSILEKVLSTNSNHYDFCLCNPPFFENIEEIKRRSSRAKETLVMTAKKEEILADGGEVTFVKNLIRDSLIFKDQICLYSSMFGRKKSFLQILKELQSIEGISYVKTEFCQGNTIRWGIAWTFLKSVNLQKVQFPKAKKPKKAKPPLLYKIPNTYKNIDTIKKLSNMIESTFHELEIIFKVVKCAENYAELQITADKNTWSHQRRKRREFLKDKEDSSTIISLNSNTPVINETKVTNTNSKTSTDDIGFLRNQGSIQSSKLEDVSSTNFHLETLVEKSSNPKSSSLKSTLKGLEIKENPPGFISNENVSLQNSSYMTKTSPVSVKRKRKGDNSENSISQKLKVEEFCLSMINDSDFDNSDINKSVSLKSDAEVLKVEEKDAIFSSGDFSIDAEPMNISNISQPLTICKKREREDEDFSSSTKPQKLKIEQTDHRDCSENSLAESGVSKEKVNIKILENISSNQSKRDSYKFSDKNVIDTKERLRSVKFDPSSLLFSTLKLRKAEDHILLEMNCPPEANRESMHQIFQLLKNKFTVDS